MAKSDEIEVSFRHGEDSQCRFDCIKLTVCAMAKSDEIEVL